MYDPALVEQRLSLAQIIVAEAASMARDKQPAPGRPQALTKGLQDYVTETDIAVEAYVSKRLASAFPEDGFVGEEGGRAREGAFTWVIDPIDGTSNYARGRERWCVSLGLMAGHVPVAGVINAPPTNEVYIAQRDKGAWLNGHPLRAATVHEPRTAMVEIGWSAMVSPTLYAQQAKALLDIGIAPRTGGCGALALSDVASGRLDGYLENVINLWDVAAALVLLHEAGARVSPFIESGGLTTSRPILAVAEGLAEIVSRSLGFSLEKNTFNC